MASDRKISSVQRHPHLRKRTLNTCAKFYQLYSLYMYIHDHNASSDFFCFFQYASEKKIDIMSCIPHNTDHVIPGEKPAILLHFRALYRRCILCYVFNLSY